MNDIPIELQFLILSSGTELSECMSSNFYTQILATSTNLTEFDEFLLPITKNISHFLQFF